MTHIEKRAKEILSKDVYKEVLNYCKVTEFSKEQAFADIFKCGLKKYCSVNTYDTYDALIGDKKDLSDFVLKHMDRSFDTVAIEYGYTKYSDYSEKSDSNHKDGADFLRKYISDFEKADFPIKAMQLADLVIDEDYDEKISDYEIRKIDDADYIFAINGIEIAESVSGGHIFEYRLEDKEKLINDLINSIEKGKTPYHVDGWLPH